MPFQKYVYTFRVIFAVFPTYLTASQFEKKLDFADFKDMGIKGIIASWVHTSDESATLKFLPNAGAPWDDSLFDVPALYVLEKSTTWRQSGHGYDLVSPSFIASSQILVGRLEGLQNSNDSILFSTYSGFPALYLETSTDIHPSPSDRKSVV